MAHLSQSRQRRYYRLACSCCQQGLTAVNDTAWSAPGLNRTLHQYGNIILNHIVDFARRISHDAKYHHLVLTILSTRKHTKRGFSSLFLTHVLRGVVCMGGE